MDVFIQLGAAIAREELKGEPGAERLAAFIEGDLRRDAKEAIFYFLAGGYFRPESRGYTAEDSGNELLVSPLCFVGQFAEERGYVSAKDFPKLLSEKAAQEWLLAFIASKMGQPLDEALRGKLAFVTDSEARQAAYQRALASLGMTEEQLKTATEPLVSILPLDWFGTTAVVSYALVLPPRAEQLYFRGSFDAEARQIRTGGLLAERPVTGLFYAIWVTPDAAWQEEHLGRVALRGKELAEYVLWENSLVPEVLARWQKDADGLVPGGNLLEQLETIRKAAADDEVNLSEGTQMLKNALQRPAEAPAEPAAVTGQ